MDEAAQLRAQLADFRQQQAVAVCAQWKQRLQQSPVLVEQTDVDLGQMRDALMQLRSEMPDMALVLGSVAGGKPMLTVVLGQQRVDAGLNAGNVVRTAAKEIQGGGGGQPGYATAGGKDASGMEKALQAAKEMLG